MEFVIGFKLNTEKSLKELIKWIQGKREWLNENDWSGHSVDMNLSDCTFFLPGHIVLLACLVEEMVEKHQIKISFTPPKDRDANQYLENIRFFEYWNDGLIENSTPNQKLILRYVYGKFVQRWWTAMQMRLKSMPQIIG